MNGELDNFSCPACEYPKMARVNGTDGTYQCERCDYRTHQKIEANRDDLEELAASGERGDWIAAKLVDTGR